MKERDLLFRALLSARFPEYTKKSWFSSEAAAIALLEAPRGAAISRRFSLTQCLAMRAKGDARAC